MTPEERSLLERTHKLSEENNKILKGMRRMSRVTGILRVIYWTVIILAGVGAYYFIQPYVDSTLSMYENIQDDIKGIQGVIPR